MTQAAAIAPKHPDGKRRCAWCGTDPLYVRYHDEEWGVPQHDDRALFEMLCLEGAQAGLSWLTVLRKREHYRRAFDGFDARKIARYDAARRERLLQDPGIVRNRLKVEAFVANARAYLDVLETDGSFDAWLWRFAPACRPKARWRTYADVTVSTPESDAMSRALKARGFKFVGTTICYAFMQAVGIVDDHQHGCFAARPRSTAPQARRPP
jgi:DNA-3-methyladenine glycosylase I